MLKVAIMSASREASGFDCLKTLSGSMHDVHRIHLSRAPAIFMANSNASCVASSTDSAPERFTSALYADMYQS